MEYAATAAKGKGTFEQVELRRELVLLRWIHTAWRPSSYDLGFLLACHIVPRQIVNKKGKAVQTGRQR
jgi:hypothetical protein